MSHPPGGHAPPPPGSSQYGPGAPTGEERNWALVSHVGAIVAAWFAMALSTVGTLLPSAEMLISNVSDTVPPLPSLACTVTS